MRNEVGYDVQADIEKQRNMQNDFKSFETTDNIRKADDIMACKHQKAKYPV
jgi:hypothetical protein